MNSLRKHRRLPIALPIHVRCGDNSAPVPATVLDVSLGGLGIVAQQKMSLGTLVELQLEDFPGTHAGRTENQCRVVSVRPANIRARGFRIGLLFTSIDEEFVESLLHWVRAQTLMQKRTHQLQTSTHPQWL